LLPTAALFGKYNDWNAGRGQQQLCCLPCHGGRSKMSAADARSSANVEGRPLYVCIEIAANLVYLARHSGGNPEQQQQYLDRAAEVLLEIRHHPDCHH